MLALIRLALFGLNDDDDVRCCLAGALDWETEMNQVINTFNRALITQQQQQCWSPYPQQVPAYAAGNTSPIRTRSVLVTVPAAGARLRCRKYVTNQN